MSKLHKKCFLASAGTHGLLFLVMLVGPAFLMSRDQAAVDMPTLEFIPSTLIDKKFSRVSAPEPAPPKPPVKPAEPVVQKKVEAPKVKPVEPKPAPKPEPRKYTKAKDIKVDLGNRKRSPTKKPEIAPPRPNYSAAAREILKVTSSTSIQMPSMPAGGGPAYANYAQAIKSIYERNWYPPEETSRDDALVRVEIVIAKDGTILSSRIIGRSGDSSVDGSVEATLRRVKAKGVPPFPSGAKESKRTYKIGFNLKARRAMG